MSKESKKHIYVLVFTGYSGRKTLMSSSITKKKLKEYLKTQGYSYSEKFDYYYLKGKRSTSVYKIEKVELI